MLEEQRKRIDEIDRKIVELYQERMEISCEVGKIKSAQGIALNDYQREKQVLNNVTSLVKPEFQLYTKQLFLTLFDTSKAYQSRFLPNDSVLAKEVQNCISKHEKFPFKANVACQGALGSYSTTATEKLFEISDVTYFKDFQGVFTAVEKGLCEFGVLPIENSSVGSVNQVYDLMKQHNFNIVRSVKQKISHSLLAKHKVDLSKLTEVVSHEQAINQCRKFIKSLPNEVKITVVENTAISAKLISESDRDDICCIASENCSEIYNLKVLKRNIQDSDENYTRFICISKEMKIYEGFNKISVMVNLPHEAGSLNKLLSKFSVLNLNLTKLESRPLKHTNFEFMFYFDFVVTNENTDDVLCLLNELSQSNFEFNFLGGYKEIV